MRHALRYLQTLNLTPFTVAQPVLSVIIDSTSIKWIQSKAWPSICQSVKATLPRDGPPTAYVQFLADSRASYSLVRPACRSLQVEQRTRTWKEMIRERRSVSSWFLPIVLDEDQTHSVVATDWLLFFKKTAIPMPLYRYFGKSTTKENAHCRDWGTMAFLTC